MTVKETEIKASTTLIESAILRTIEQRSDYEMRLMCTLPKQLGDFEGHCWSSLNATISDTFPGMYMAPNESGFVIRLARISESSAAKWRKADKSPKAMHGFDTHEQALMRLDRIFLDLLERHEALEDAKKEVAKFDRGREEEIEAWVRDVRLRVRSQREALDNRIREEVEKAPREIRQYVSNLVELRDGPVMFFGASPEIDYDYDKRVPWVAAAIYEKHRDPLTMATNRAYVDIIDSIKAVVRSMRSKYPEYNRDDHVEGVLLLLGVGGRELVRSCVDEVLGEEP